MKSFLKSTLASIIGFLIGGILLILLIIGIFTAIAASSDSVPQVKSKSVLEINFNYSIADKATANPLKDFNPRTFKSEPKLGLNSILNAIENAKTDNKIKGIFINIIDINANFGSMATIEEIRNKLIEFKKSNKFIVAYSNIAYTQKSYYLSTVADKVYFNPGGMFFWAGMGGEMAFYKKALNKLGIEPQVVRHGKYKAAVEPFLLDKMSDANREQMMKYIGGLWNHMLEGISKERGISVEKLNQLADNFKLRETKELVKEGLFDKALYYDEVLNELKTLTKTKKDKKLRTISLNKYIKVPVKNKETSKNKIAVIYATGEIGMTQSSTSIGPDLATTIRKIRKDDKIKAVVLRVNSPGGSALTSEIIWREVKLLQKTKPVIVSMGNVAASGGYYIACAADTIVASPTTLTGSIGIFGLFFSGEDLIKNKIGLSTDSFGTNKHSNFGGGNPLPIPLTSRKLNKYERKVMQEYIEVGYKNFVDKVAEGRGMTFEQIDAIGQGRVWTGEDAIKIGLVDVLGGLETAIEIAREKANLENYTIKNYPKEEDPFSAFFKGFSASMSEYAMARELGTSYIYFKQVKDILKNEGIQARIPYNLEIK
jgi:protease-4